MLSNVTLLLMANSQLDPQTVENNNEKENIYLVQKNVLGHLVMTLLSCEAEKKGHSN